MARKKSGGAGPKGPTPISSAKSKSKTATGTPPAPIPDLVIPGKLLKATPRQIENGAFQKRLLTSILIPLLGPDWVNGMRRNLRMNNTQTEKLMAEMYGMTSKSGGMQINVNQNSDNRTAVITRSTKEAGSPDEIYRGLAAERERRKAVTQGAPTVQMVATPLGEYESDKPVQKED